jgi:hypothetical protein
LDKTGHLRKTGFLRRIKRAIPGQRMRHNSTPKKGATVAGMNMHETRPQLYIMAIIRTGYQGVAFF